jgi:hypothetical protein
MSDLLSLRSSGDVESATYIPDMSCDDPKCARHRQRQAAYEARLAAEAEQFLAGYRRGHCDAIGQSSRLRDASHHIRRV